MKSAFFIFLFLVLASATCVSAYTATVASFDFNTTQSEMVMSTRTNCDKDEFESTELDPDFTSTCDEIVYKTTESGLDFSDNSYSTLALGAASGVDDGGYWQINLTLDNDIYSNISQVSVIWEAKESAGQVTYFYCYLWNGSKWIATTTSSSGTFITSDQTKNCSMTDGTNLSKYIIGDSLYALLRLSNADASNPSTESLDYTQVNIHHIALETVPPAYSNFVNNASSTTTASGVVNWSVTLEDNEALSGYKFAHNDTGSLTNGSLTSISGTSAFADELVTITSSRNNYVCGQFWFTDTSGNVNQTNMSCFTVVNSAPNLTTDLTFTNYSTKHRFNVSAVFSDGDNASDIQNTTISTTSGACTYLRNITLGNDFTVYYNCTGTALASATIQINATDYEAATISSSLLANVYPNNAPTILSVELNKTSSVLDTDHLNCSIDGAADADDDTISYYYEWYNNSVAQGINNAYLRGANLTGLGTWYCEAWLGDGAENSSKYTSTSIVVNSSTSSPVISIYNATSFNSGLNSTSTNPTNNNTYVNLSVTFTDANTGDAWTAYFCSSPTWTNCRDNTSGVQHCTSAANSTSTVLGCSVPTNLYSGVNTYYSFVTDNTSLVSAGKQNTFEINLPAGAPALIYPANNAYIRTLYTLINWSASDPDSDSVNSTVYINGAVAYNGTAKIFNYSTLTEYQTYNWSVYTEDQHSYGIYNISLGNFTADFTNPNLTVSSPTADAIYNSIVTSLTVTASDFALNQCNYTLYLKDINTYYSSGTASCSGTTNVPTPYYAGGYSINVFAYDQAGNYNSTQVNFTTMAATTPTATTVGGGGTAATIKEAEVNVTEIVGICGNNVCEQGESPWTCSKDCPYTKMFELDEIFCTPILDCGNWKTAWFNNIIVILVMVSLVYFYYTSAQVGRLQGRKK